MILLHRVRQKNPLLKRLLVLATLWVLASSACTDNPVIPGGDDPGSTTDESQEDEESTETSEDDTSNEDPTIPTPSLPIPEGVAAENPANEASDPSRVPLRVMTPSTLEKRYADGLGLDRTLMCRELGNTPCFSSVFHGTLGGSRPRARAQGIRPVNLPALAPVALDRIARQVCRSRLDLDKALGARAFIFKFFTLNAAKPSAAAVAQLVHLLYQRLLLRQPSRVETTIAVGTVQSLGLGGEAAAQALCFAVASSMELLLTPPPETADPDDEETDDDA